MTPALRLAISLVLSLLLWLPTVTSALTTNVDPAWIAGRYLLALLVARIGVGMVFRVITGYAAAIDTATAEPPPVPDAVPAAEPLFGRRRDDDTDATEALLDEALEEVRDQSSLVP